MSELKQSRLLAKEVLGNRLPAATVQIPEREQPGNGNVAGGISAETSSPSRRPLVQDGLSHEKKDPKKFRCCCRPTTPTFLKASFASCHD